jgi:3',5'-cyclic AMP phosphodiesterase CpdA
MIRLAHFSDVHLTTPRLGWRVRDLLGKRSTGWVNVKLLGRGKRFRFAERVMESLKCEFRERRFDHLVFSGDATTMAFDSEVTAAAERIGVGDPTLPPGIAVPGNHDLYTFGAVRRRMFESAFAPWQRGERADPNFVYPFAQKVGPAWLIALNSARANLFPWDATGKVGKSQLERLRELCSKLGPGPRIIVSHYPIFTRGRKPEPRWHRLKDWKRARDVAAECGASLWLHGHKHAWYVLGSDADLPFPTIDVGSSTQEHLWGYHEYEIEGEILTGLRRTFDLNADGFTDADRFEVKLRSAT